MSYIINIKIKIKNKFLIKRQAKTVIKVMIQGGL